MRPDQEKWLDEKIKQDLMNWADEQEKLLNEDEELKDLHMPKGSLEEIHRRIALQEAEVDITEVTNTHSDKTRKGSGKVRIKMLLVLAAALVLAVGAGTMSSGKKVYEPQITEKERGEEVHAQIDNAETVKVQYDEEEVCREIQEKLGVLPIRFGYRPKEMFLTEYHIFDGNESAMIYDFNGKNLIVYISKDYDQSSIDWQTDGELIETLYVEVLSLNNKEVIVNVYETPSKQIYYNAYFEYLNTYYDISGMMEKEEFIKMIENINLKNV